jgi:hypothetical protein
MATPLFRSRDETPWVADRATHEMEARKRNWRPWIMFGALGAVLLALAAGETEFWRWWHQPKVTGKEPSMAFNAAGLGAFHHPPVEAEIVEKPVDKPIQVQVPSIKEVPVQAPPPPKMQIEKMRPSWKIAFAPDAPPTEPSMIDGRLPIEAWGCAIRPGENVIHASLNDDVRWDFSGPISAKVTEDVYSPEALAVGQRRRLIPMGATLVGSSSNEALQRGMNLAPGPTWSRVEFTDDSGNPRSINLFNAAGAGASGINGIGGTVDQHWKEIIEAAVFFTLLDTLSNIRINVNVGGNSGDSTVSSSGLVVGGSAAASIGEQVLKNMISWKPVIFTPKGQLVTIKPLRPIRVC